MPIEVYMKNLCFLLMVILGPVLVYGQERSKPAQKSEAELRREIRAEMQDSLNQAARQGPRMNNNADIDRDELEISFEIEDIEVEPVKYRFGDTEYESLSIDIPEAEVGNVSKAWEQRIEDNTKSKAEETDQGLYLSGAYLESISNGILTVHTSFVQTEDGVKMITAFLEEDKPINGDEYKLTGARAMLKDFGVEEYRLALIEKLGEEEKVLKQMEKDLEKLQKDNEKIHKNISDSELEIINLDKEQKANLLEQDRMIEAITSQNKKVSALSGDAKKEAKKDLKDLEKEHKGLQKDLSNIKKDIVGHRADIEEYTRELKMNLAEQDFQKARINQQVSYVKSLEAKIATIEKQNR